MNNIRKIFRNDLNGLLKNFLALVVAIGLCLLPALYAWFNIYANWDPYANTGNIDIAVVNLDEGWTDNSGTEITMGDNIVESLKEKTSIHWVFPDSEEEAVDAVKAGTYYAALVIDSGFSYGMYNGFLSDVDSPKITYYVNDKKNAVATKITDSAVTSVQSSIDKEYVNVIVTMLFEKTNTLSEDMSASDTVDAYVSKLEAVEAALESYDSAISTFIDGNQVLSSTSAQASSDMGDCSNDIDDAIGQLSGAQSDLETTQASFNTFSASVEASFAQIQTSLDNMAEEIEAAQLDQDAATLEADLKAISTDAQALSSNLDTLDELVDSLSEGMSSTDAEDLSNAISAMKSLADSLTKIADGIDASAQTKALVDSMKTSLSNYSKTISELNTMYTDQIVPEVNDLLTNMEGILSATQGLLSGLNSTTGTMSDIFTDASDTLDTLNTNMTQIRQILRRAEDKITSSLDSLDSASDEEKLSVLINLLAGDPETLGLFFSEPVQVENHYIYEIENYGSGVAPFYTTLAIWVGMTILVSLIKVHANNITLAKVTKTQLYFGRYLLFLLLSQIQTLIIVLGDLYILKIQCVHPFFFWLAAAITSLTFSLLVYSLTIAFGDIGKALAVVIMVIQIAGSGGTYPIEALPSFFRSVYIFFPFPYAINAMRECIGGMYQSDYGWYLGRLGLFCAAAVIIGMFVRVPFIRINEYIEKRMEDTRLM